MYFGVALSIALLSACSTASSCFWRAVTSVSSLLTSISIQFSLIPTGLFFEIPEDYEVQIRPRSGLAAKNGVTVLNTPGTIDSDYRGEIKVILVNLGSEDFTVSNGDRIAQMVVAPVITAYFTFAESLSDTDRGSGGMGSTGVKE